MSSFDFAKRCIGLCTGSRISHNGNDVKDRSTSSNLAVLCYSFANLARAIRVIDMQAPRLSWQDMEHITHGKIAFDFCHLNL